HEAERRVKDDEYSIAGALVVIAADGDVHVVYVHRDISEGAARNERPADATAARRRCGACHRRAGPHGRQRKGQRHRQRDVAVRGVVRGFGDIGSQGDRPRRAAWRVHFHRYWVRGRWRHHPVLTCDDDVQTGRHRWIVAV